MGHHSSHSDSQEAHAKATALEGLVVHLSSQLSSLSQYQADVGGSLTGAKALLAKAQKWIEKEGCSASTADVASQLALVTKSLLPFLKKLAEAEVDEEEKDDEGDEGDEDEDEDDDLGLGDLDIGLD